MQSPFNMRWDNNIDYDELLTEYTEEKIWCPATQRKAVISSPTARRSLNPYLFFADT